MHPLIKSDVYAIARAVAQETASQRLGMTIGRTLGNDVYVAGQAIGNPGAAPNGYIFAAMLLTAQASGIFEFGWGVPFTDTATGDSVACSLKTTGWSAAAWAPIATTGNIAMGADSTAIGATGPGTVVLASTGANPPPPFAVNGGSNPSCYFCTTAGTSQAPAITGAGSTVTTQASMTFPTLTGMLSDWWSGQLIAMCGVSIAGNKTPFAVGSPVLAEFIISATDTISIPTLGYFWGRELPLN